MAIGYHSNGDISLEHADNKTTHARHIISCERIKGGTIN